MASPSLRHLASHSRALFGGICRLASLDPMILPYPRRFPFHPRVARGAGTTLPLGEANNERRFGGAEGAEGCKRSWEAKVEVNFMWGGVVVGFPTRSWSSSRSKRGARKRCSLHMGFTLIPNGGSSSWPDVSSRPPNQAIPSLQSFSPPDLDPSQRTAQSSLSPG